MDKMAAISKKIFYMNLDDNFISWFEVSFQDSNWLEVSIGSSNDLAPSSDKPLSESILD